MQATFLFILNFKVLVGFVFSKIPGRWNNNYLSQKYVIMHMAAFPPGDWGKPWADQMGYTEL